MIVDLMGMGKRHAWVNGLSIGRYWPSYLSNENDYSSNCDFRGAYLDGKCATNGGKPIQRWYYIPRSYLNYGGREHTDFIRRVWWDAIGYRYPNNEGEKGMCNALCWKHVGAVMP
ncbi:Beta-galactosidase 7, partial [Cucurbita argyrosperma subsp. sororia]